MRRNHYVYTAATLTAALAFGGVAAADTVSDGLTVAATWRAQPSSIEPGGTTTFKLSLRATGADGVSGISFDQSVFTFASGSSSSVPTSAEVTLDKTALSAGSSANALLAPLQVTYAESGLYNATIQTSNAGISWLDGGEQKSGTYSVDLGTTVAVAGAAPVIQAASVPLLISAGESFGFSALADAGGGAGNLTYEWDFDFDGTFTSDSTGQSLSYAYASPGVYSGMLRVLSDSGSTPFEFTVNVLSSPVAPLPPAAWGGLGLMAAFGVLRALQLRRAADESRLQA